jgi:hypothetical protein
MLDHLLLSQLCISKLLLIKEEFIVLLEVLPCLLVHSLLLCLCIYLLPHLLLVLPMYFLLPLLLVLLFFHLIVEDLCQACPRLGVLQLELRHVLPLGLFACTGWYLPREIRVEKTSCLSRSVHVPLHEALFRVEALCRLELLRPLEQMELLVGGLLDLGQVAMPIEGLSRHVKLVVPRGVLL